MKLNLTKKEKNILNELAQNGKFYLKGGRNEDPYYLMCIIGIKYTEGSDKGGQYVRCRRFNYEKALERAMLKLFSFKQESHNREIERYQHCLLKARTENSILKSAVFGLQIGHNTPIKRSLNGNYYLSFQKPSRQDYELGLKNGLVRLTSNNIQVYNSETKTWMDIFAREK